MKGTTEHWESPPNEEAVEELLATCLDLPEEQQEAAVAQAAQQHPELATELWDRFEALCRMGLARRGADAFEFPERLGDFRLVRRLGGGGMGIVYLAIQESLNREVALKLIRPEQLFFPGARERFRRETEAAARLQHPGIVPIYTVGEQQRIPYFAMERVQGCTLAEILASLRGAAPESLSGLDLWQTIQKALHLPHEVPESSLFHKTWVSACMDICQQSAAALTHSHDRGIIHRDIKPSNIMLTHDGRVLLFDFGLTSSQGDDRLTKTGSMIGTLYYMPPEQLRNSTVDARSDIYSLGVTLYELLTLQVPYQGSDTVEIQKRILDGRPDPIRARNRKVSSDAETICLHAMELEPGLRYQTAKLFAEDVEAALVLRPIKARPPGTLFKLRRWAQRNPALSVAMLLAVLLFVGGPLTLWLQQREHSRQLQQQVEKEKAARAEAERLEQVAREEWQTSEEALSFLSEVFIPKRELDSATEVPSALDILERGEETLHSMRPKSQARIKATLGSIYMILGRQTRGLRAAGREFLVLSAASRGTRRVHDVLHCRDPWAGGADSR